MIFLNNLNNKIVTNLKALITQMKTRYNLSKKFSYNRNYEYDEDNDDEYVMNLSFNSTNDNDQIKIFNLNKKRVNMNDFKSMKNVFVTIVS